jgi:hypothetical protein
MLWKPKFSDETATSKRDILESVCGKYRIVHSMCQFGPKDGPQAIPDVWYAMKFTDTWDLVEKHRQQSAAEKTIDKEYKADLKRAKEEIKPQEKRKVNRK